MNQPDHTELTYPAEFLARYEPARPAFPVIKDTSLGITSARCDSASAYSTFYELLQKAIQNLFLRTLYSKDVQSIPSEVITFFCRRKVAEKIPIVSTYNIRKAKASHLTISP